RFPGGQSDPEVPVEVYTQRASSRQGRGRQEPVRRCREEGLTPWHSDCSVSGSAPSPSSSPASSTLGRCSPASARQRSPPPRRYPRVASPPVRSPPHPI